jgi:hypothetical protein
MDKIPKLPKFDSLREGQAPSDKLHNWNTLTEILNVPEQNNHKKNI